MINKSSKKFFNAYTMSNSKYLLRFHLLENLNKNISEMNSRIQKSKKHKINHALKNLSSKEIETINAYLNANWDEPENLRKSIHRLSKRSSILVDEINEVREIKTMQEPLVRELILVNMITTYEEFLKTMLTIVFKINPKILKSNKTLDYDEILNCKSFSEIEDLMITKKLDSLTRMNIENIVKDLNELFKLNLTKRYDYKKFLECYYHRHVIIHNDNIPDKKYISKFRTKNTQKLIVSEKYLSKSLDMFQKYCIFITRYFSKTYPTEKTVFDLGLEKNL